MPPAETKLPNFFLVGAPKAGTTSLYHHLAQHPQIYMSPIKETSYFSLEVRPENFSPENRAVAERDRITLRQYLDAGAPEYRFGGIVETWPDYQRLFANARNEKARGEATVTYLWSSTAAREIAVRIPRAKILMVLRNPIDRAFSQYTHNLSAGAVTSTFREHLAAALTHSGNTFSVYHPFLEIGLYAEQVARFQQHFPAAQLGIWLYEDTQSPTFLQQVFHFLEVDPAFTPDTARRYLEPTATAAFEQPERDQLRNYYRADIQKLERLIHRDLSHWQK